MKRRFCILLDLLLLLALSACGAAHEPSRLPNPDEVKALLVELVDVERRAPGIVVGMIAADPEERWVVGYGRFSATDERVPDGDTVFEIASNTKVFTGTLLAEAVLNGEVQLDDPISTYLPEGVTVPEYEGRTITLLDLATHTSGLPREPSWDSPSDPMNPYADYTIDQMYDFLSGYHLTRAPGSEYLYSNYGFALLSNLLVRQTGSADYDALLLERITGPLGMESTSTHLTPDMRYRMATPHRSYDVVTRNLDSPTFAGCGGILSTANDLLTFLAANMGITDTELRPALQLANTPQRPGDIRTLAYIGLGWHLPGSGNGIHYHGGLLFGYTSFLAWDTERKIGAVVLMNVANGPARRIGFPLLRDFPLTPVPVDLSVLAAYAGRYQFDGFDVTIRVDGARIYFKGPDGREAELIAISEDRFYLAERYAEITFHPNDRGEVDRMEKVVIGGTLKANKVE